VTVHVHALGGGISHAIGTGGRDLKDAIGGITALQALDLLERDPESRVIVIISKPPEATTAARLLAAAQNLGKPVVICFSGYPPPATRLGNVRFAVNLREAAELAVSLLDEPTVPVPGRYRGLIAYKGAGRSSLLESSDLSPQGPPRPGISGYVRGLFAGGTLASETLIGLHAVLSPLYSNMTSQYAQPLQDPTHSQFHTILDLGGDEFTVGRLHPMIDNDLRLRRLSLEAEDPEVGLICLDVVLGHGAHPDPASELAPAILEIRRKRAIEIVVILIGTEEDPQDAGAQESRLFQSGATIFRSSAEGVAYISARLGAPAPRDFPQVPLDTLETPLAAINVGLEAFYTSLRDQGAEAVQVEWRPPAGGKEDLMAILAKLKD
jgi:FdrA protein